MVIMIYYNMRNIIRLTSKPNGISVDIPQDNNKIKIVSSKPESLSSIDIEKTVESSLQARESLKLLESRKLREQQDREYELALQRDKERVEKAILEAEEAALILKQEIYSKRKDDIKPPSLLFPIESANMSDIYILRFKLPDGSIVTHSFHKDEPLSSIIQQAKFDLKYEEDISIFLYPKILVNCSPDTPISFCGFSNKILVIIDYV